MSNGSASSFTVASPVGQPGEDRPAGRVGQRRERGVEVVLVQRFPYLHPSYFAR